MVESLGDKYTRILNVEGYSRMQKYDLIGVGADLQGNENGRIVVGAPPIAGTAASKAGLQRGDFINAVNGVPTAGRSSFSIIDQLAEVPDQKIVTFTVESSSDGTVRDVELERGNLIKDPVDYKISERRSDGTNVGYIHVKEFNSLAPSRLESALSELRNKEGANAFVLDLRTNGGGAFQSAVEMAGYFFDDKVATYVVDGNQNKQALKTPPGHVVVDPKAPVVIWLDGFSASATEVFASALHDNCRAVVMGDTSYGKGIIQAVYGLKNGYGFVLTVAKYLTPSETEIQGIGIKPDILAKEVIRAPYFIPKFGTDTSKVDFNAATKLLKGTCVAPQPLVGKS